MIINWAVLFGIVSFVIGLLTWKVILFGDTYNPGDPSSAGLIWILIGPFVCFGLYPLTYFLLVPRKTWIRLSVIPIAVLIAATVPSLMDQGGDDDVSFIILNTLGATLSWVIYTAGMDWALGIRKP